MKLTVKENINRESIVLKHKIALEAVALLSEKDNILDTETEMFTILSLVDNFVEENVLDEIGDSEEDFANIIANDIEPKFYEIIDKYEYKNIYDEILEDVLVYLDKRNNQINTFVGLINEVYNKVKRNELDDLKFFFNKVASEVNSVIEQKAKEEDAEKKEKNKQIIQKELEGASEKMAELISKFEKQGANAEEQNNG